MKGQIDPTARITAGRHATGVGAMGRDDLAGLQPDIGQKPFVTADQNPWNQVRKTCTPALSETRMVHACTLTDMISSNILSF